MTQQSALVARAQKAADETGDQELVADVEKLERLSTLIPSTPYEKRDPLKLIRADWEDLTKILQQDIKAVRRVYKTRRANLRKLREAPADRLTVAVNQSTPTVDPHELKRAQEYQANPQAYPDVDVATKLRYNQVLIDEGIRKQREAAKTRERVTLGFNDALLTNLETEYGDPAAKLQRALWRVRIARLANTFVRALIGLVVYLIFIVLGTILDQLLGGVVSDIRLDDAGGLLLLALVILVIEWIKGLTIERYFEDWLRAREHEATASEVAAVALQAADVRILVARVNAPVKP